MRLRLEIAQAPSREWVGQVIEAEAPDSFVIGRSRERTRFCVGDDQHCSRVHALILVTEDMCWVRDLGSMNGTFVNGQRIEEAILADGDRIELGPRTVLQVRIVETEGIRGEGEAGGAVEAPAERQEGGRSELLRIEEERMAEQGEMPQLRFVESGEENVMGEQRLRFATPDDVPRAERGEERRQSRVARVMVRCRRCGREVEAETNAPRVRAERQVFVCEDCRRAMRERGDLVPGYRIERLLSRGGQGDIWLAVRESDGEQVVIKTLIPERATNEESIRRFLREIRIAERLNHRNIVRSLGAGECMGLLYMVMEYVEGSDVDRLRRERGGRVDWREAGELMVQVLEGLSYAHGQGVVHRDLKPGNILLQRERRAYVAKVADFGLARARGTTTITQRGGALGTLPYMAPEQLLDARSVDERADIFGAGATLYHLVTGFFVYDLCGEQGRDANVIAEGRVVRVERRGVRLPRGLVEVINRATAPDPRHRYRAAEEMRAALQGVLR